MAEKRISRAIVIGGGESGRPARVLKVATDAIQQLESKQLPPDVFAPYYDADGLVPLPISFDLLVSLAHANTYHGRSIAQKVADVIGHGWHLRPLKDHPSREQKERIERLLEEPNPDQTFHELLEAAVADYVKLGNAYIEVARGGDGQVSALWHMPASTVRRHKSRDLYCQIREPFRQKVWFVAFGSGKFVHKDTGQEVPRETPDYLLANEVLHVYRYSDLSDWYGYPDYLYTTAVQTMAGVAALDRHNRINVESGNVPAYSLVIQGAELDDKVEATIREYFQERVGAERRGVLIIPIPYSTQEVQVSWERLALDPPEGGYLKLRESWVEEILVAHGMPPYRVGMAKEGSLGGTTAKEMTEIYKRSIIGPIQEVWEHRLNRLLRVGLQITDWAFKFDEIDTTDEELDARIDARLVDAGIITRNEARRRRQLEPLPGGDRLTTNTTVFDLSTLVPTEVEKQEDDEGGDGAAGPTFRLPGGRAIYPWAQN